MSVALGVAGVTVVGLYLWICTHALKHRSRPGAFPLVALSLVLAFMTGVAVVLGTNLTPASTVVDEILIGDGLVFASLLWALFVFEYTGRGPTVTTPRAIAVLLFGGVSVVVQRLVFDIFDIESLLANFVVASLNLTVLSLAMFGVFLVVRAGVTYDDLPPARAFVVAGVGAGVVLIWAVGIVFEQYVEPGPAPFATMTALLGGISVLGVVAQTHYQLLETEPSAGHLARDRIIEEMGEAVLVTDRQNKLLDYNKVAEKTFGLDPATNLGQPLEPIIGRELDGHGQTPVTVETPRGTREFVVRESCIRESGGQSVGTAYLLRDTTDEQTHEQQLAVLNRVLRHNLRNDLDSIRGFAEPVRTGKTTPDETLEFGERIQKKATEVVELGSMIGHAEEILAWEMQTQEHTDVVGLAREVAEDEHDGGLAGRVEISATPQTVAVRTNPDVLRAVLAELVENGLKHAAVDAPTVTIEVQRADEHVVVTVSDQQPAIPEHEREVLLAGEETPLRHGSGVGLWVVYWGVQRLGGTISFAENADGGSDVILSIPAGV